VRFKNKNRFFSTLNKQSSLLQKGIVVVNFEVVGLDPDVEWISLMGYLQTLKDISENCVIQHLKVSNDKNRIDCICKNCVVRHNLWDCVNRP
jgi:hypothetical protein